MYLSCVLLRATAFGSLVSMVRLMGCMLVASLLSPGAGAIEAPVLFGAGDGTDDVFIDYETGYSGALRYEIASDVKSIACGGASLFLIKNDGTLWACGQNDFGQLGDGTRVHRTMPVLIASDVTSAAGGATHLVFLKSDGSVWSVGADRVAGVFRVIPGQVATGAVAVAAGSEHTVFLRADGTLWGFGSNSASQIGPGALETQATPIQIASDVAAIAAGGTTTMWVGTDGSVWGVGSNSQGQLGDGTQTNRTVPVKIMASGAAKVGMGSWHSFVIKNDGSLWGAGMNSTGQLGIGYPSAPVLTHTFVANGVAQVDGGSLHSLICMDNGFGYAAGLNTYGNMGTDNLYRFGTLGIMAGGVKMVATGDYFSAVLGTGGTVATMGKNDFGQLAIGRSACRTPRPIRGVSGAASARWTSAIYRLSNGSVIWTPSESRGSHGAGIEQVAAGGSYDVVLSQVGQLRMWDRSGTHYPSESARLVDVPNASTVTGVVSGTNHFVFIKQDASLWAMGSNTSGQLGDGTTTSRTSTPVLVATGVAQVSTYGHTLFVKSDGTLWGTGLNINGQLGNGSTANLATPVQIATDVTWAAGGGSFSAFVKVDGTLWLCGSTPLALPNGTLASLTPLQVTADVVRVWAGTDHVLILKSDHSLWAGGGNLYGQLGDGSYVSRTTLVKVADHVLWAEAGVRKSLIMRMVAAPAVVVTPDHPVAPRGGSTTLTAQATGEGTLTYQWYLGESGDTSTPIDGATSASFTTPTLLAPVKYWVQVSNPAGSSDSATSQVAVSGPVVMTQPVGTSVTAGASATLSVSALGDPGDSLAHQWYLDGVAIPGATGASITWPSAQLFHAGTYTVSVTGGGRSVTSHAASVVVNAPPASTARLLNLSTRALDLTGDNLLIPGFVVEGTGTKRVLIRGVGPGMQTTFGLPGALADPQMTLLRNNQVIASNDNWGASADAAALRAAMTSVGAFPLLPDSKDAAILIDLPAGRYTALVPGAGQGTGIAMVELYDADTGSSTAELVNISNRGFVDVGDTIMIPGFVVSNEGSRTLLVRAVGPGLASTFGLQGVLADPVLTVYRESTPILSIDDWDTGSGAETTRAVAAAVGAFPLVRGSADAAFVITLPPGGYTVHARGDGGSTGIALVELYLVR